MSSAVSHRGACCYPAQAAFLPLNHQINGWILSRTDPSWLVLCSMAGKLNKKEFDKEEAIVISKSDKCCRKKLENSVTVNERKMKVLLCKEGFGVRY